MGNSSLPLETLEPSHAAYGKGSLEVETALGQGTTFRVFIPAKHQGPSTIIEL